VASFSDPSIVWRAPNNGSTSRGQVRDRERGDDSGRPESVKCTDGTYQHAAVDDLRASGRDQALPQVGNPPDRAELVPLERSRLLARLADRRGVGVEADDEAEATLEKANQIVGGVAHWQSKRHQARQVLQVIRRPWNAAIA
jgi:hypothetical protein